MIRVTQRTFKESIQNSPGLNRGNILHFKKRAYEEDEESKAFHQWLVMMKIPHDYSTHGEQRPFRMITKKGKEIRICPSGARLKSLGASEGFPDFTIPVPNEYHHGLYIEMKKQKNGKPTKAQLEWIDLLVDLGYCAVICNGWDEARMLTEKYMQTASKCHRKTT
jgi:hypothetical protein